MSKTEAELPERLRSAGATDLERRLLDAAGREAPSRELTERMAVSLGIAAPSTGGSPREAANAGKAAAPQAVTATSSFLPWVAAVVVAAAVGAMFIARRPAEKVAPATSATSVVSASPPLPAPSAPPSAERSSELQSEVKPAPPVPSVTQRRLAGAGAELAAQIALVDAARAELAGGGAQRALKLVDQYQARYPSGAFRPEVSAVKVEALMKLGRTVEARALAERFLAAHGPSPLAERVARLAGLPRP